MVDGFWKEFGRHLFDWSAWIFTVGGTVIALWLAREHWWISLLIVLTFAGATLTFSYRNQSQWRRAEEQHQTEMNTSRAREQAMAERLQEVERKLLEVPLGMLVEFQQIILRHSTVELARLLVGRSELVVRMKNFSRALNKPLNLRRFFREAGLLFIAAKGVLEAIRHLRVGDPFVLLRVGTDKLESRIAELFVQQVSGLEAGVVLFRVAAPHGEEIQQIERLTVSTEIAGMRGYRIIPATIASDYPDVDLVPLAEFIHRMVQDLAPEEKD